MQLVDVFWLALDEGTVCTFSGAWVTKSMPFYPNQNSWHGNSKMSVMERLSAPTKLFQNHPEPGDCAGCNGEHFDYSSCRPACLVIGCS